MEDRSMIKTANSRIAVCRLVLAALMGCSGVARAAVTTNYYTNFDVASDESIQANGTYNAPSPTTGWDYYGTQGAGISADSDSLWNYCSINNAGAIVYTSATAITVSDNDVSFSAVLKKSGAPYEEAVLLVQMDGATWYAWDRDDEIDTTFSTNTWRFDPHPANWQEVTLVRETSPTLGSAPANELIGDITGFGLLHDRRPDRNSNTLTVDAFTVETSPLSYREVFGTNTSANLPAKGWDWAGTSGSGAVTNDNYVWMKKATTINRLYTEDISLDLARWTNITLHAKLRVSSTAANVAMTFKVNGTWFEYPAIADSTFWTEYGQALTPGDVCGKVSGGGAQGATINWDGTGTVPSRGALEGIGFRINHATANPILYADDVRVTGTYVPPAGTVFVVH